MFMNASKAYRQYKNAGETVTACLDRLNNSGNKIYKGGRKLSSLEVPLLASLDDVMVAMDIIPANKVSAAFGAGATPRYELLPFQNLKRTNCIICKSNNSCIAVKVREIPGTICTMCRAVDFTDSVKEALKEVNLLENFDKGYQVAELLS
ncbi:hypothetical protein [Ewingella americana]|uniref:Uncharacterized protein n=1 Tax=Ewingella americana TaxID=41202 RepID=A0A502GDA2_9GAMM|nr:hypothetical protein [Ewingella americana]TPG60079.1 hypothetical protein EAH77_16050 [Ewingella americana]